jgi:hypothetical protein
LQIYPSGLNYKLIDENEYAGYQVITVNGWSKPASGGSIDIQISTLDDGVGVKSVAYKYEADADWKIFSAAGIYQFPILNENGDSILFQLTDRLNNSSEIFAVPIKIDRTGPAPVPSINLQLVKDNLTVTGVQVNWAAVTTDYYAGNKVGGSGVKGYRVGYKPAGTGNQNITLLPTNLGVNNTLATISKDTFTPGQSYQIGVQTIDNLDNPSGWIFIDFDSNTAFLKPTRPFVNITVGDNIYHPTFNWSSTDDQTLDGNLVYKINLDGQIYQLTGIKTFTPVTDLSAGTHTFKVEAIDEDNQISDPAIISYNTETHEASVIANSSFKLNEMEVVFPGGSGNFNLYLDKTEKPEPDLPATTWAGNTFKLGPYKATLSPGTALTADLNQLAIPPEIDKEKIKLYYYDYELEQWVEIDSTYDPEAKKITGHINQLEH